MCEHLIQDAHIKPGPLKFTPLTMNLGELDMLSSLLRHTVTHDRDSIRKLLKIEANLRIHSPNFSVKEMG
jgi:hypothetical protein